LGKTANDVMTEITIYTKGWCPYCQAAKELLTQKGAAFTEISIEKQPDQRAVMITRSGGKTTVPQIFIAGKHVGGCDDLHALEAKGGLDALLAG
jgi:glutaredoxin 3